MTALGYQPDGDTIGAFGPATSQAVMAFQRARGLRCDGVCGRQTWSALVEAGRRLGDRLLYHKRPMQRGDDVAELQRQLGALGFDAGRVDGIFGPQTEAAVRDFQRNVGLAVSDGMFGPETLKILMRVSTRTNGRDVVSEIRERQRLRDLPPTLRGRRVVVGESGGLAALADSIRRHLTRSGSTVITLNDPDESVQASQANRLEADVYIGVRLEPDTAGCRTAYFMGHNGVISQGGRGLAETVQATVPAALGIPDLGAHGMRLTVLRETRMPAILVELGPAPVVVEHGVDVAAALERALGCWVSSPCEPALQ
ncbi:MAG: peptidoglycan-binding protein [Actinomycetota bacterium]|nr:peptidoglycan-binding protein [Actinomycetota bacterium]